MDQVLGVLITFVATAGAGAGAWWYCSAAYRRQTEEQLRTIRELEKHIHAKERDFLADRNQLELRHADAIRVARTQSFEEGRAQGLSERTAEHMNELEKVRLELLATIEQKKEEAAVEAREKLRNEYELQSKLFSVKISPYVKIGSKRGILTKEHETAIGYQYQLLINGIPAFTPHVVTEGTEVKKEINEKVEALLIDSAQQAADAAIQLYLGGAPQFARRGPPLVEGRS